MTRSTPKSSGPKPRRVRSQELPENHPDLLDLTKEQLERKAWLLSAFRTFAANTGLIPDYSAQPHDEMCDEMELATPAIGTGDRQDKAIYLAPRYTYKTSLEVAYMIFLILKFRELGIDISMDYVRATSALAEDVLYELKMDLQTIPVILELWGDLSLIANLWSAKSINLSSRRDATVTASGADYGGAGKHPDIVFFDDLVNEKNYQSIKAKRNARTKIQAYYPILPPWGSMFVSGTRFAHDDVYGWLLGINAKDRREHADDPLNNPPPQWREYIRSVRDKGGNLFFPSKLTEAFLAQQKRSLEARFYAAWYDNRPDVEGMQRFKSEYLDYFSARFSADPIPMLEVLQESGGKMFPLAEFPVRVTMTLDPTVTANGTSDWTGIVVNATDAEGHWWILVARRYLLVPSRVGEEAVELIRRYRPAKLRIESANADVDMVSRIQRAIYEENLPTVIESYHPLRDEVMGRGRRQKAARIEALEPAFRNGGISLHRNTCEALYDQYVGWPDVDHDDVFDALAMQYGLAKPCEYRSIEDYRGRAFEEDDLEEPGNLFGDQTRHVLYDASGRERIVYASVPKKAGTEPRYLGRAGRSSQRLKTA